MIPDFFTSTINKNIIYLRNIVMKAVGDILKRTTFQMFTNAKTVLKRFYFIRRYTSVYAPTRNNKLIETNVFRYYNEYYYILKHCFYF